MDIEQVKEREAIKRMFKEALELMLRKNSEYGNASREIGLLGLFLEVRTMFLRLRNLVWDNMPESGEYDYIKWKKNVKNALEDLRNYTILAEISLDNDNLKGPIDGDEYLRKK